MVGPPGAGKTILAGLLPTTLPAMARQEAPRSLGCIRWPASSAGLVCARPLRAPHHSISQAGLLGGGSGFIRPGEASFAQRKAVMDEVQARSN
jgi:magnesium chelatase family protein